MANGAENSHPHLELAREEPVTERRPRRGFPSTGPPDDPRRHATELRERLQAARDVAATEDVGGYDERRLIKITLADKAQPEDVARAAGNVQVVGEEEDTLLLAFAGDEQLAAFEARLTSLATGERVSYRQVLYALQDLDRWTPDDRMGWALKRDGFPIRSPSSWTPNFWSLERGDEARKLRGAFERWRRRVDREPDRANWFNAEVPRREATRIPEYAFGRRISETIRSKGTVQASTWTFKTASESRRDGSWFVAVTRNDPPWGTNLSLEHEPYALTVVLNDRAGQELRLRTSRLFAAVEARLRARPDCGLRANANQVNLKAPQLVPPTGT